MRHIYLSLLFWAFLPVLSPAQYTHWGIREGGFDEFNQIEALTTNDQNEIFISGFLSGKGKFQWYEYDLSQETHLFVAKISNSGELLWMQVEKEGNQSIGTSHPQLMTVDGDGNCYVLGRGYAPLSIGDHSLDNNTSHYLLKLTPNGNVDWIQGGSIPQGIFTEMTTGPGGKIYLGLYGHNSGNWEGKDLFPVGAKCMIFSVSPSGEVDQYFFIPPGEFNGYTQPRFRFDPQGNLFLTTTSSWLSYSGEWARAK